MDNLQLLGVDNCPHCGVASPLLLRLWNSDRPVSRSDGGESSFWSVFQCTTCGHLVSAKGVPGLPKEIAPVSEIFPDIWEVSDVVPDRVSTYITQAHRTLHAPDASVVMSASSIDAMLKDHRLDEGSLYSRIDKAVEAGVLTQTMADWAHRVRLDANNPRHADDTTPHMTQDDAQRAFEFAKALTEYLYVLPSRMPPKAADDG